MQRSREEHAVIGTISDRVAVEIGGAFGAAAAHARKRMERSHNREKEGQPGSREDTYTDDLLDAMEDSIRERLRSVTTELSDRGNDIRVEFEATKASQGEESEFGLDLGIRAIIETPGYSMEKAILVQCKRMYGTGPGGTFPELRGRGEEQARKMLAATPASFYFFFCAGDPNDMWKAMGADTFPPWPWLWPHRVGRLSSEYLDPGICVIPATRVYAMSRATQSQSAPLPIDARRVLAGGVPIGHFIASLFAPCFVGDPRTSVLQLATPPRLRGTVRGVDAEARSLGHLQAKRWHELRFTKRTRR